jgi:hypothetical protein
MPRNAKIQRFARINYFLLQINVNDPYLNLIVYSVINAIRGRYAI